MSDHARNLHIVLPLYLGLALILSGCMKEQERAPVAEAEAPIERATEEDAEKAPEDAAGTTGLQAEILLKAEETTGPVQRPRFEADDYADLRAALVRDHVERDVTDTATLAAMRRVPRHEFVDVPDPRMAYLDRPLPIGHGQTISQPYIVAYMTDLLDLEQDHRVLEVGTGSAYQAAILAEIARKVVSIEIVEPLARAAAARLKRLGYNNVTVIYGDGYYGWPEEAPYDSIIVTAAAEHIPPPLVAQLKPGGRMVIPVGPVGWTQNLLLVEKREDGSIKTQNLLPVTFVPFTRKQ